MTHRLATAVARRAAALLTRPLLIAIALTAAASCAAAKTPPDLRLDPPPGFAASGSGSPPAPAQTPPTAAPASASASTTASATPAVSAAATPTPTPPRAGTRITLGLGAPRMSLAAGRWVVEVAVPPEHYVTIGVAGPREALATFEVVGRHSLSRLRTGSVDDDDQLPSFVSFQTRTDVERVLVIVDARAPIQLLRHAVSSSDLEPRDRRKLKAGLQQPRPLIGLPVGLESRAGYRVVTPPRYAFVRTDVAAALRAAFRQTRIRYRRNLMAVGDASQWNGDRPATDVDKPRHISHQGGRDVDIGLPTREGSLSTIKRRCEGVMVEEGRLECGPGTVRDFDAARAAYLLSLLIDGPTPGGRFIGNAERRPGPLAEVEVIFTDQAYIDAIRKELPKLRTRRWIHDEAFGALGEEGLLRASPWHTDHIHIRFKGESAGVAEVWKQLGAAQPARDATLPTKSDTNQRR